MPIPPTYALCYIASCPRADQCMHHRAMELIDPASKARVCILPHCLDRQGQCEFYHEYREIQGAYGFTHLLSNVKSKDSTPLRNTIKNYLGGHGTFYRYHNGERILTPEQQEWILSKFRQFGYTTELHFDHYVTTYDFTE